MKTTNLTSSKESDQLINGVYGTGLSKAALSPVSAYDDPKIFINDSDRIIWEEDLNDFVPKDRKSVV
mgnify:CR=1 FL=1